MKLLDGNSIEPTSPGGTLWQRISDGEQIIALESTTGQQTLDLTEAALQHESPQSIAGWLGSLSLSTAKGLPDDYSLDLGNLRDAIFEIQESLIRNHRSLPLLVDVDACFGNPIRTFAMLNVLQVALGVTENKRPDVVKVNSLTSGQGNQSQMAALEDMNRRLVAAKGVQKNTLIGARIENLIYGSPSEEIADYMHDLHDNADLILVHWNKPDPAPLFEVADAYMSRGNGHRPLMAVTTAYGANTTPQELLDKGFQVLIYPNQIVRKSLSASREVYDALLGSPTAGGAMDAEIPPTREVIRKYSDPGTFTYQRIL